MPEAVELLVTTEDVAIGVTETSVELVVSGSGPPGPPGPPGAPGAPGAPGPPGDDGAQVYVDAEAPPPPVDVGQLWFDTDDPTNVDNVVPAGGLTGQVLTKLSDADFDDGWADAGSLLGPGTFGALLSLEEDGSNGWLPGPTANGQLLVSELAEEYASHWVDAAAVDGLNAATLAGISATELAPQADAVSSGGTRYASLPGVIAQGGASTFSPTASTDYVFPIVVTGAPITLAALVVETATTATSGNSLRLGIARLDGRYQGVGAPLAQSGAISADAPLGVKRFTLSPQLELEPGYYGLLLNVSASFVMRYSSGWPISGLPFLFAAVNNLVPTALQNPRAFGPFPSPVTWSAFGSMSSTGLRYQVFAELA